MGSGQNRDGEKRNGQKGNQIPRRQKGKGQTRNCTHNTFHHFRVQFTSICSVGLFGVGLELKSRPQQLVGFQLVVEQLHNNQTWGATT